MNAEFLDVQNFPGDVDDSVIPDVCFRLPDSGLEVQLLPWEPDSVVGQVRQLVNDHCRGDIIVSFDDDDVYPDYRISAAVTALVQSKSEITGTSALYLYDTNLRQLFKFNKVSDRHATHISLAYTKRYARENLYGTDKSYAEEKQFCQNFSSKITQLSPESTVLQIVHGRNTFEKSQILHHAIFNHQKNQAQTTFGAAPSKGQNRIDIVTKTSALDFLTALFQGDRDRAQLSLDRVHALGKYVPSHVLGTPDGSVLDQPEEEGSDVAFYCGILGGHWDPEARNLGGSEQAVVQLATCMAKKGIRVHVYGSFRDLQQDDTNATTQHLKTQKFRDVEGVRYFHAVDFPFQLRFNRLILWRLYGMAVPLFAGVQAQRLSIDLHDNVPATYWMCSEFSKNINDIFVKSRYHGMCLLQTVAQITLKDQVCSQEEALQRAKDLLVAKIRTVFNGIRPEFLELKDQQVELMETGADAEASSSPWLRATTHKSPVKVVYASCYKRGLVPVLQWCWPVVRKLVPNAELHCYYGRPSNQDPGFCQALQILLGQEGVIDHGRVGYLDCLQARAESRVQLHWSNTVAEVDCISIREALAAGCVPIISSFGVFAERDGYHLKGSAFDAEEYRQLGEVVASVLLMTSEEYAKLQTRLVHSQTLVPWHTVAERWAATMFSEVSVSDQDSRAAPAKQYSEQEVSDIVKIQALAKGNAARKRVKETNSQKQRHQCPPSAKQD